MPESINYPDKMPVEAVLYSKFIPYAILRANNGLDPVLPKQNERPLINIFIDVYEVLRSIFRFYKVDNELSITSCLANLGIHYRNLLKKYGVYSNVFLFYSSNNSTINTRFCPSYNNTNTMRLLSNQPIQKVIDQNIDLFRTVCKYLPDIYFRIGTVEPSVMIADTISKFHEKNYTIRTMVVSTSPIAFQIPLLCKDTVLYAYKRKQGLLYTVDEGNAFFQYLNFNKKPHEYFAPLSANYLSTLMILMGISERNLPGLVTTKKAFEICSKMIRNQTLPNPDDTYMMYRDEYPKAPIRRIKTFEEVFNQIHNRFRCVDLSNQLSLYNTLPESKEISYLSQLQDKEALIELNERYFKQNPMQLDLL